LAFSSSVITFEWLFGGTVEAPVGNWQQLRYHYQLSKAFFFSFFFFLKKTKNYLLDCYLIII
jgi:hypothetical protein